MSRIFSEASGIVDKYGGMIEQFIGDEIMVLFGVPAAHEDDPVRAVMTALEIHARVEALNPEFESKKLRISYTSLVTPNSVIDYDLAKRTRELKKQQEEAQRQQEAAEKQREKLQELAESA